MGWSAWRPSGSKRRCSRHMPAITWLWQRKAGDSLSMASALLRLGHATWPRSDYATARDVIQEELALFRQVADQHGSAYTLVGLTIEDTLQENYPSAIEQAEEALVLSEM